MTSREINLKILQIRQGDGSSSDKLERLIDLWEARGVVFDATNFVTLIFIAAQLAQTRDGFRIEARAAKLMNQLAPHVLSKIAEFTTLDLSKIARALASLRYYHRAILCAFGSEVERRAHNFSPSELADLIWAYALLRYYDPTLLAVVASETSRRLMEYSGHSLINTIWAFAVLNYSTPDLPRWLLRASEFECGDVDLQLLFHATLAFNVDPPGTLWERIGLLAHVRLDSLVMDHEETFAQFLRALGVEFRRQQSIDRFQLDFLLTVQEGRVNIELDGRHHYLRNTFPPRLCGSDALRDRLLAKRGVQVVRIPLSQWRRCDTHQERCALVLRCWKGDASQFVQ